MVPEGRRQLRRELTIIAALRVVLVTASLGTTLVDGNHFESRLVFGLIITAYGFSLLYLLALRGFRHVEILAYVQIPIDVALITTLVFMTGGSESVFTAFYGFVVLGGAMTLTRRGAFFAALLALFAFGTLLAVQQRVGLPAVVVNDAIALLSFSVLTVGLGLTALLASTLAETARRRADQLAEKAMQFEQLEDLHAAILRSLPAGLMLVNQEGVVHYVNESALRILRATESQVLGRRIDLVVPAVGTSCMHLLQSNRTPSRRDRYEGDLRRPGGSVSRIGYSFAPLSDRDPAQGVIAIFQDVTDVLLLKEAVVRAERLATVGQLSAGLAHEIRNPLSSMCASIEVLGGQLQLDQTQRRLMRNVLVEAERLNGLISDFLDFARPKPVSVGPQDVNKVVAGFFELLQHDEMFCDRELKLAVQGELFAEIDADAVRQILWNLVRNASEAITHDQGQITITTREVDEWVDVVVRDNGPGIPPEQRQGIFDPFFTTKTRGTGLGLAIVHSLVQSLGARILVSSEPGDGSEFVLRLPAFEGAGDATDPALVARTSQFEVLG